MSLTNLFSGVCVMYGTCCFVGRIELMRACGHSLESAGTKTALAKVLDIETMLK